jgi:hypothetical protein
MEFIDGQTVVKYLWSACSACGCGVEVQWIPQRDASLDVSDTVLLTFAEATRAREGWKEQHKGACQGPVRHLEAVPA